MILAKVRVIIDHGTEEQKELMRRDNSCRHVIDETYREVIRDYKEQHNQWLPWELSEKEQKEAETKGEKLWK